MSGGGSLSPIPIDETPINETPIDETGRLIRDAGGFLLAHDLGGTWRLLLHRVPVNLVEKRVRVRGNLIGADMVEADGVTAA